MTQNPGQWGPQGGYPPQGQSGYPPQQPSPGYPPQQPGQGYPPQGGYPPQPGYNPQGTYAPQPGAYPPQGGAGGYGPQPPQGTGFAQPTAPAKKSPAMIIGIVVAAVVLLAAVGGIIMVLNRDGDQPPAVSITPSQPVPPTEEPTESTTPQPTDEPTTDQPQPTPTETSPPSGDAIDLGNGISVVPATGWTIEDSKESHVFLTDGKSLFRGEAGQLQADTNPAQLCAAWHKQVTENGTNGEVQDSKEVNVNPKVNAATCQARFTVSNGQGSQTINLFSLVSVRKSDGVTIVATAYYTRNIDEQKLDNDYDAMANSMLGSQING